MRTALDKLLEQEWDAIVLDHYGTAWALRRVVRHAERPGKKIVVVHVSHNHEENLSHALFKANSSFTVRGGVLLLNWLKIAFWERRMTSMPDIVTAITREDRDAYWSRSSMPVYLTLTPGHSGAIVNRRVINAATPRNVVIVGSYRWGVKEQNLRKLLLEADNLFVANGIILHVIGDVTDSLKQEFQGKLRSTVLHGFVDDFAPYLAESRIALVPEVVGGGFKLKFLDYIFGRIPVATIEEASAGLPEEIRRTMLQSPDMKSLVESILHNIDDIDLLNEMQEKAFEAAANQFSWADRGSTLVQSIIELRAFP